jgi:hypothetical protein
MTIFAIRHYQEGTTNLITGFQQETWGKLALMVDLDMKWAFFYQSFTAGNPRVRQAIHICCLQLLKPVFKII